MGEVIYVLPEDALVSGLPAAKGLIRLEGPYHTTSYLYWINPLMPKLYPTALTLNTRLQ